jgi:hypothetical protein
VADDTVKRAVLGMRAADVRMALRRRFAAPECAIVFEVAQGTGYNVSRHLDAVAMDLWPSRGLSLHGIEIKVNVQDWRREKTNPVKAEQVARFCDYFWIAAPAGVVPIDEVPPAWGLIEIEDNGKSVANLRAEKTNAQPINRDFMAAMLRASSRVFTEDDIKAVVDLRLAELEETFRKRVEQEAARKTESNSASAASWDTLVRAIGRDPDMFWDDKNLIAAVQVIMKSGIVSNYNGLRSLHQTLVAFEKKIGEAVKEIAPE